MLAGRSSPEREWKLTLEAGVLDRGAGDSVRASAGRTDGAPLVVAPGIAMCLRLGEVIAGGRMDGLVDPTTVTR